MKILYLYYMMKLNGPDYNRSRRLTDRLSAKHRLDMKYLVLPDENYVNVERDDPGFPELISASQLLTNGYNCVIIDDWIYQGKNYPRRIPQSTLKAYHDSGGTVCFFFGDPDSIINSKMTLEDMREYLGACNHAHGSLYPYDSEAKIIKGVQFGDSHLEIEISEDYLKRIPSDLRCIYNGVTKLIADWAFHLLPGGEYLLIGDDKTAMITDGDLYWDGPKPFIFGNMTRLAGTTIFLTGHLWKDYIVDKYGGDNLTFLDNLLDFCAQTQKNMGYHKQMPLVFLSYSHKDAEFVDRIAAILEKNSIEIWRDIKEIRGGQSITKKIEEGLRKADFYLLILSQNSLGSPWVDLEYRTALNMSIVNNKTDWIIPVVTDVSDKQLLGFSLILSDRKYINFNKGFQIGINDLLNSIL